MKRTTTTAGWLVSLMLSALLFARPETPKPATEGGPSQDAAAPRTVLPGTSAESFPPAALEKGGPVPSPDHTPQSDPLPTPGAGDSLPPAPVSFDLAHVRATGQSWTGRRWQRVTNEGSAVPLGGGRWATVGHLVEGLQQYVVEVEIDDTWTRGSFKIVNGADAAIVTANGGPETGAEIGTAHFADAVVVRGLASQVKQWGLVSNDEQVSLASDSPGIEQGDSGGGVFDAHGHLLGLIRGRNQDEPRVCYFTDASHLAPRSMAGAARATVWIPATWHCPGCIAMQSYDWGSLSGELEVTFDPTDDAHARLRALGYSGEWRGYPVTTFTDRDGTIRVMQGPVSPAQLLAKWKQYNDPG